MFRNIKRHGNASGTQTSIILMDNIERWNVVRFFDENYYICAVIESFFHIKSTGGGTRRRME